MEPWRAAGALCIGALLAAMTLGSHAAEPAKKSAPRTTAAAKAPLTPPPGDAAAGREKADAGRCFECHGADARGVDHGTAAGVVARLAGQPSTYIVKQLQNFRSGARKQDVMRVMTQHLDEQDQRDIAAYFASLPAMYGSTAPAPQGGALFAAGAASCASCHGEQGRGGARAIGPVLAGQNARYLEQQLRDWRSGWRSNSADGSMSQAARALGDAEIAALVAYLAGQAR